LKSLYENLGLEDFAKAELIKKKYRQLAKIYHPDKNPNNPVAEERFKQISRAYKILSNAETKIAYDADLNSNIWTIKFKDPAIARAEKIRKFNERKIKEIEDKYQGYQNSFINLKTRIILCIISYLICIILFIFNYYLNYNNVSETFILLALGVLHIILLAVLTDVSFLHFSYKGIRKALRFSPIEKTSIIFLSLFIALPIIAINAAFIRKQILLKYNSKETKILELTHDPIEQTAHVTFFANYTLYTCKVDLDNSLMLVSAKAKVIYYPNNPRLCKIQFPNLQNRIDKKTDW